MPTSLKTNPHSLLRITAAASALLLTLFPAPPAAAAIAPVGPNIAIWTSGGSNEWNTNGNWSTEKFPNSTIDQAIFSNQSAVLNVSLFGSVAVDSIIFDTHAGPYTISTQTSNLDFWGAGIVNNSGHTQTFINGGVWPGIDVPAPENGFAPDDWRPGIEIIENDESTCGRERSWLEKIA